MRIRPTKLELIRLKKKYRVVKKAEKMLKDKLDTQMAEIVKIWREAFRLRKELEQIVDKPYQQLAGVASLMGNQEFMTNLNFLKEFSSLGLKEKKLLNIYVPKFELNFQEHKMEDISMNFPKEISRLRQDSINILTTLINMAENEESIRQLIDEVRSTKIKVNALKKTVIPKIEKDLVYLKGFLTEKDMEERVRLKKVKEMI